MNFPASPLFIALQFMTTLPISLKNLPKDEDVGYSALHYPLVGAVIGGLMIAFAFAITQLFAPYLPQLTAALLVALWVGLTGGLHLDGLADSADAWAGGFGDRQKTLDIMKDPTCGPMGVLALVLVLLVKFAALVPLVAHDNWQAILLAPTGGRMALVILFLSTPYVRKKGLGAVISSLIPQQTGWRMLGLVSLVGVMVGGGVVMWLLLAVPILILVFRASLMKRIKGTTGDTAGALVELSEVLILLAFALNQSQSVTP